MILVNVLLSQDIDTFLFFLIFRIRMVKKDRIPWIRIRNTVGNKAYRLPGFPLIAFFRLSSKIRVLFLKL